MMTLEITLTSEDTDRLAVLKHEMDKNNELTFNAFAERLLTGKLWELHPKKVTDEELDW